MSSPYTLLCMMVLVAPTFSTWSYTRCPSQCSCYSDEGILVMDCSFKELRQFPEPETIPADVQMINISHNKIAAIPADFKFWLPDIRILDISFNELRRVPFFEGLFRLRTLDLSNNHVSSLPDDSFRFAPYLEDLFLTNNSISETSEYAFRGLRNLRQLHLGWNHLAQLPSFPSTPKLVELSLEQNYLHDVPADSMPLPMLRRLRLQHNHLAHINKTALRECVQLQSLHLSHNRFRAVPRAVLRSVAKTLNVVDLSSNPIQMVRNSDFVSINEIREINLSGTIF
ncbi:unnamed protein product [Toxocara canis]|uniref:LRRNT domain-containing protein n=1 Tax=Toxocara canis TaxID=6265 RepID=A0A183UQW6_TOXCA|nr:unnamed protein product [Toxocara canis]